MEKPFIPVFHMRPMKNPGLLMTHVSRLEAASGGKGTRVESEWVLLGVPSKIVYGGYWWAGALPEIPSYSLPLPPLAMMY